MEPTAERTGYDIAMSVNPNTSNDVCTFCRHAGGDALEQIECSLGFTSYFRGYSQYGPIWVSDCGSGELRPELKALEVSNGTD